MTRQRAQYLRRAIPRAAKRREWLELKAKYAAELAPIPRPVLAVPAGFDHKAATRLVAAGYDVHFKEAPPRAVRWPWWRHLFRR